MIYIHSNNWTVKRVNISKIANTSTLGDNSTAAGCNSRLITVLVQHAHDIVIWVADVGFWKTSGLGSLEAKSPMRQRMVHPFGGNRRNMNLGGGEIPEAHQLLLYLTISNCWPSTDNKWSKQIESTPGWVVQSYSPGGNNNVHPI